LNRQGNELIDPSRRLSDHQTAALPVVSEAAGAAEASLRCGFKLRSLWLIEIVGNLPE
jgi:hypothetical protein